MPDLTAKRTLVKSPPELWEELSEVDRLAKHLGAFGEITITKLEPEHTVAWEGERASGTVSIEPSGWGTKVTLRAELPEPEPEPAPEPEPEPAAPEPHNEAQRLPSHNGTLREEPHAESGGAPVAETSEDAPRRGFWGWLFRKRTDPSASAATAVAAEPVPEPIAAEPEPIAAAPEPEPLAAEPEPGPLDADSARDDAAGLDPERARVILDEALDTLGAAHHRPFSRG